ncbi:MAG: PKD domain-containing protein [Bacteroidota bacterium]
MSIHFSLLAQLCNSQRYQNEIFNSQVTSDILFGNADPYGISTSQDLRLDYYEPIGDSCTHRPLIVYAFGGAYLIGDKRQPDIPTVCNHFARQGYAVISIDYRIGFNTISTGSAIRAVYRGIQDLRAAVRYMCENQALYKIDTNFIFYTGSSAGCISGIHASYMTDADRPSYTYAGAVLLEPDDMGCVDCSGNTFYGQRVPKPAGIINRWGAILDTSYISSLAIDNVPMISFHGTADPAVPYVSGNPFSFPVFPSVMGSSLMHKRLSHLNIYNQLVPLVGAGHEPELLEPRWDDTIFLYSTPFLYQILKPNTAPISGPSSTCQKDTVDFSVPYTANASYCWLLDTATTMISNTGNHISVYFTSTGTHTIAVRETNQLFCAGDSIAITCNVLANPIANFTDTTNELNVRFTNTSIAATSAQWYFGDGTVLNTFSPSHLYADTGTYRVMLIVTNGVCNDTFVKTIHVYKCPTANFTFSASSNNTVYFFSSSSYADSLYWTFGDGDTASVNNPIHVYATSATYTVRLYVFNKLNCIDSMSVEINTQGNSIQQQHLKEIQVYPNPVTKNLHIETALTIDKIQVYNNLNQVLYQQQGALSATTLNLEFLAAGVYHLKIYSAKEVFIYNFIKQ